MAASLAPGPVTLSVEDLGAYYGNYQAIAEVNLDFRPSAVTALMGPSGCGKTTLLRCINRIHEITPGARVSGRVLLRGDNIYDKDVNPISLRRHIGMVFQRANPFPTLSIIDNVTAALGRKISHRDTMEIAESALRRSALWEEVKDKLNQSALRLSGGQQQRLCIARAIAVEPEVLLMDEPTSSLDPIGTIGIEELMASLAKDYTIVVVTHNMQQAARISDISVLMLSGADGIGRVIEVGNTKSLFTKPTDRRTEDYITGRFG
ncbi:MAG: phosphate ABC transporter ATP-binding protein [Candidatus Eremiobacteraeota bacterium]|nr:phosphate ABC transporter ATP-binding protein [Candidatus Eremiobacteraeota bacterium]